MNPRLASSVHVAALIRSAESKGGFAAVLAKGDSNAGAILVLLAERGANRQVFERVLQPDGRYSWQRTMGQNTDNKEELEDFLARRRKYDPDLWIIELDIPSLERFAAEMNAVN